VPTDVADDLARCTHETCTDQAYIGYQRIAYGPSLPGSKIFSGRSSPRATPLEAMPYGECDLEKGRSEEEAATFGLSAELIDQVFGPLSDSCG